MAKLTVCTNVKATATADLIYEYMHESEVVVIFKGFMAVNRFFKSKYSK